MSEHTAAVATAIGYGAGILSQAAPESLDWIGVIGNLSATGIVFWYAWFTTARTIPKLHEDHAQALREHREAFQKELADEREENRANLQSLIASIRELRAK